MEYEHPSSLPANNSLYIFICSFQRGSRAKSPITDYYSSSTDLNDDDDDDDDDDEKEEE